MAVLTLGLIAPPEPFSRFHKTAPMPMKEYEGIWGQVPPPTPEPLGGRLAQTLPEGLLTLKGKAKKRLFIQTVLPLIYAANNEVAEQRRRLIAISKKKTPSTADLAFLKVVADAYGSATTDIRRLLKMVDTVPTSLALAQSIVESGWGSANLARRGNALFGLRVYGNRGLLPSKVSEDAGFRIRTYRDLLGGVRAYISNLNRLAAYEDFRLLRALMRARGEATDSFLLAGTLSRYSEEREDYVLKLQKIIADNSLTDFDKLAGF